MKPLCRLRRLYSIWMFILALLVTATDVPTSVGAADNVDYLACKNTLSCGTVNQLTYPFWGQIDNTNNRPNSCGEPNLQITCEDKNNNNGVPKFTVDSVKYRILDWEWDISKQNLTVARDDYFSTSFDFCSGDFSNNTLDKTILQYDDNSVVNITLLYKCSSETKPSSDQFTFVQSCNSGSVYYAEQDDNKALPYYEGCSTVIFPVSKSLASAFANSASNPITTIIQQALQGGFVLKLLPQINDKCRGCTNSGGNCGSNDGHFVCYCNDGTHQNSCSGKSTNKAAIAAGAASGAVVFVVLLIGTLFVVRRRRRNAERSRSNKDILPLSGVPLTSSTTSSSNTSQSVSSYPSSKSDSVPKSYYYGVQVFDYAELEEATNNFDPSRELGEGGFGTVYKGMLQDGRVVAVKRHYESHLKRVEQYMNEVEILAHLRHKNLVTLFGCTSRHSRELILVYEFIPNGTLADHLHGSLANSTLLTWNVRYKVALETAEALSYLHSKKVIHRDVKSTNILLTETFQVKVGDFGLSRLFPKFVTHVSTAPQGTPGYVDPEYYQNYQLTDKSDVYSFGVVLVELISSLQAVDITRNRNEVNLASLAVNRIQNQELHEMVDPCLGFEKDNDVRRMVTAVAELAFRCLQQQRDMRPSMDEVLEILRGVKGDEFGALERNSSESVVGVNHNKTEEVILLKKVPPPVSPDSVADKWVSSSSTSSTS
ncbi:LEAF RUST 10 DISEASE-RESISTANCE LOCUS RECEPTOR-LIKE PROTEIN KINASE-like 1.4 isoform X2 [Arachis duranensis]|uniref:non-specific serine/threonine protein kinase n=1 Tax=Arachis duranensis TaxID=130453 RepID=A0A6P5NK67_ARADU|nr:LEAF RUST 10 DISEASE-RESISTANCE LOCUS RECEPTOR-LIKE PROTEIN KINASE-like 1.4 isoform X2 [Arachis duranensis]